MAIRALIEGLQGGLPVAVLLIILGAVCIGLVARALAALLRASLGRAESCRRSDIGERARVEEELRGAKVELEERVEARTAELTEANRTLERELAEKSRVERELERANLELAVGLTEQQRRNQAAAALRQTVDLLQSCLTVEEAASVVARSLPSLFPETSGSLALLKPSRNMVEIAAAWGEPGPGSRVFAPDDCWALRRGQMHAATDPGASLVCRHTGAGATAPFACVPLTAQGDVIGVLSLRAGCLQPDRPDQRGLMLTTAENIALAIANVRLRERLRDQAIRDPLTGLFNRRYMEESLDREVRRAARSQRPLAIVMMDLDHFKAFNDVHGHAAGDALLRELGGYLRAFVRAEDIACRYGGEEFTLILPEVSHDGAWQRAELLRECVKQLHLKPALAGLRRVTLSLGVATFPEHGTAGEGLLRVADEALYQAKSEGRDRVVVAPLPAGLKAAPHRPVARRATARAAESPSQPRSTRSHR